MIRRVSTLVCMWFVVSMALVSIIYAAGGPLAPNKSGFPSKTITILVPSSPGGGWDLTGRSMQHAFTSENIMPMPVEVINKSGGGGTVPLADFVTRKDPHTIMITGLSMLTSILTQKSPFNFKNVVPLARLTAEHEVIAVGAGSKYKYFKDLIDDFKKNPKSITWSGATAGSIDYALVCLIAQAAGVEMKDVNYVSFSGVANLPSVMSNQITVGVSGYSEYKPHVDAGKLRFLAVSSEKRIANDPTPTIKELGLDITLGNWRSVVASPEVRKENIAWLLEAVTSMRSSKTWQDILSKQGWTDMFLTGDDFTKFLDIEMERYLKVLKAAGVI